MLLLSDQRLGDRSAQTKKRKRTIADGLFTSKRLALAFSLEAMGVMCSYCDAHLPGVKIDEDLRLKGNGNRA